MTANYFTLNLSFKKLDEVAATGFEPTTFERLRPTKAEPDELPDEHAMI